MTSTKSCVEGLFDLLGFRFAHDKLAPFSTSTEMLGVVVDTAQKGMVKVDNKESRKRNLVSEIKLILQQGSFKVEKLPMVLGRVQYAEMRIAELADMENWPWPTSGIGSDCKTKEKLSYWTQHPKMPLRSSLPDWSLGNQR